MNGAALFRFNLRRLAFIDDVLLYFLFPLLFLLSRPTRLNENLDGFSFWPSDQGGMDPRTPHRDQLNIRSGCITTAPC